MFYSDLIEKYEGLIVYIDVDRFYINSDKEIEELKIFNHSIEKVNYFYAEELKKYVKQDEHGEISIIGYSEPKRLTIESLIKREMRRRKLERIGIN